MTTARLRLACTNNVAFDSARSAYVRRGTCPGATQFLVQTRSHCEGSVRNGAIAPDEWHLSDAQERKTLIRCSSLDLRSVVIEAQSQLFVNHISIVFLLFNASLRLSGQTAKEYS